MQIDYFSSTLLFRGRGRQDEMKWNTDEGNDCSHDIIEQTHKAYMPSSQLFFWYSKSKQLLFLIFSSDYDSYSVRG